MKFIKKTKCNNIVTKMKSKFNLKHLIILKTYDILEMSKLNILGGLKWKIKPKYL